MAVNSSNWFSNAIVGVPLIAAGVDIYEVHTTPKYAIGTGFERQDGAVFRYAHFGDVITVAGLLCAQDFSESGTAQIDSKGIVWQSCTQVPGQQFDVNKTGSYYIQIGAGNTVADQFAGGYICMSHDSATQGNKGYTYRIKGNTASGDPVSGNIYIELYSPLQYTVGSATDINIAGCMYANLESADAVTDNDIMIAGVNCARILNADRWGWVQTKGVVGIQGDPSFPSTAGDLVTVSDADTGQCTHMSESTVPALFAEPIVGYCIDPGAADTEYALVMLNV